MPINRLSRRSLWVLTLFVTLWGLAPAAESAQSVILVRHAERAGGMSADVGISGAGQCRAQVLANMLADAGVKRIYVTEVGRTQQTAEPLARKLDIVPQVIPAKDIGALVTKLRNGEPRGVALVVGHANTLPEIIERLGGGTIAAIADNAYDWMFVVTLIGPKQASVVRLRYPGCTSGSK
jgi:broad specificity phosphatase PhoE